MILKIQNWTRTHTLGSYDIFGKRGTTLFRGICRDPLETVKHAESECQAWFDANQRPEETVEEQNT